MNELMFCDIGLKNICVLPFVSFFLSSYPNFEELILP